MCTIVSLNKSRINLLRELNSLRNDFNFENNDFFDVSDKVSYHKRFKITPKWLIHILLKLLLVKMATL